MRTCWVVGLVVCVVAAIPLSRCSAQEFATDKGSRMIGGGLAFSSMGGELYSAADKRTTVLAVNPSIDYFVAPGVSLGGLFVMARTTVAGDATTTWSLGPRVMFFFAGASQPSTGGATYPYLQAYFLYNRGSVGEEDITSSGTTVGLGVGMVHMISREIGISADVAYDFDNMTFKYGGRESSGSGNRLNLGIGLAVFLY